MKYLMALALLTFGSLTAHANLLIEPYGGYAMGNMKTTAVTTNVQEESNIDGFAYGGRVGWNFGAFFLGGEYQAMRGKRKIDGSEEEANNWENKSIFGLMGLQSELGFRIFAGITVRPHESTESTSPERTKLTGSAQKIGIGYRYFGAPFALNAEYIMYKLDKYEVGALKGNTKDLFSKSNYNALMLSISFPFELGNR